MIFHSYLFIGSDFLQKPSYRTCTSTIASLWKQYEVLHHKLGRVLLYHGLCGRWRCFKPLASYWPCLRSRVKFKKLFRMLRTTDAKNDGFENAVWWGQTPRPTENAMRRRESRRAWERRFRRSQAAPSCYSWGFNFFISFAKLSEVTLHLANVLKAISSLLPILSISYYAANPGWLIMLHCTKTIATWAQLVTFYEGTEKWAERPVNITQEVVLLYSPVVQ